MSIRSQLIGSWKLVSLTATLASDPTDVIYPMTPNAKGVLIYSADGYMSCQQQTPGIPPYSGPGFDDGTPTELAAAAKGYLAYSGPFSTELDQVNRREVLLHTMTTSLIPNWVGQTQKRLVHIEEEPGTKFLFLAPEAPMLMGGQMRVVQLKWQKL